MYEDAQNACAVPQIYAGDISAKMGIDGRQKRTLRENIDAQTAALEKRLEELKATKERMEKSGILDMRIDDLQQAMRC